MEVSKYENPEASAVLIQPVNEHDLAFIESEIAAIRKTVCGDFGVLACKVENWNCDLSPWEAPAVFGKDSFGNGAQRTLNEILQYCADSRKTYSENAKEPIRCILPAPQ